MKTTYQIMGITQEVYNNLLLKKYLSWCLNQARNNTTDLQVLLSSKRNYRFFMVQITGFETEFIEESQPYQELNDSEAMVKLWHKCVGHVFYYYSPPIQDHARKVSIINKIQLHDLN